MARRTLTAATTLLLLSVVASCSSENGTSERQSEAQVGKSEPAITKETDALVELIQEAGQGSATARLTLARKYTESGIAARVDALMWLILAGRGPFAVGQFGGDSSVSGNAAAMGRFLGEVEALEIRLR